MGTDFPMKDEVSNADAPGALFAEVYDRLKAMASRQLERGARDTLDTTGLVHELYLRFGSRPHLRFDHEAQFFAYAAKAMRTLLADRARDRLTQRAGGAWARVTLDADDAQLSIDSAERAMVLDDALTQLERIDPRAARVVELRYFAGLTLEQVAPLLGMTESTVVRDWRFARAFLHERL
jgi:RNA polymerase sigma factor (TIGR02999 family)